ncbi:MAG: hypothetical protein IGS03_17220 [Candidatus Sericytochromatia bacterium]|nr:hypothetical protein [Candidatus Sericytochromatia bacterium]
MIVDLGYQVQTADLQALLDMFWAKTEVSGPQLQIGTFRKLPQASEGQLSLPDLSGKCYTKLESDNMGYPQNWPATVLLSLSLYKFPVEVAVSTELQAFLIGLARQWYALYPYRLAVIANSSCFYINADFANTAWLSWQQDKLSHLLLPDSHPLVQTLGPQASTPACYAQNDLAPYCDKTSESERYQAFKSTLQQQTAPAGLKLEWESD